MKFIVAVSGGVDSVVLLHQLLQKKDTELLVAHVNHGIRSADESDADEEFVRSMCQSVGVEFVCQRLNLGPKASEDLARTKRHEFLRALLAERGFDCIATAHHQDDVIETMVINLLRGTGRKGLSSLKNDKVYIRPLINLNKQQIINYAKKNNLKWVEDSTNQDLTIFRNYVRSVLIPKMQDKDEDIKSKLIDIYTKMLEVNQKIDDTLPELNKFLAKDNSFDRTKVIMLPIEVSYTWLHWLLTVVYRLETDSKNLQLIRNFIHTAKPNKTMNVAKQFNLHMQDKTFSFIDSRN